MLLRYYSQFDGQPAIANIRGDRVRIGSAPDNDIVLNNRFIGPRALELVKVDEGWEIRARCLNGCETSGQKLQLGEAVMWNGHSSINIFPFVIQLQEANADNTSDNRRLADQVHEIVRQVHLDILKQMHLDGSSEDVPKTLEGLLLIERSIESVAARHGILRGEQSHLASELAGTCLRDEILTWLLDKERTCESSLWTQQTEWSMLATAIPEREEDIRRWTIACTRQLFGSIADNDSQNAQVEARIEKVEKGFWEYWDGPNGKLSKQLNEYLALRQLKKVVKDTLFGFGPLEDLLRMPTITEIMVNASHEIFVEKKGVLQNSGRQFVSDEVTMTVIERIVGRVGRRIDTAQPMVDARLPDGSRVNAIIPPLAVKGPCLTIRKFAKKQLTVQDLLHKGSLTAQVIEFLQGCVRAKRSVLVAGGTGTGKTTLLNCLSQAIPRRERNICIEDTHELQLDHPHVVFVECRDGNNEGKGKVAIRDLLKNALRQRPDRLIIGECRGDEALDMLQAMNTGHDGSMTTIHANNPADALRRLEVLVRDSGLPSDAVRQQIVSAVDIIVQLSRRTNGDRYVSEVAEVVAYEAQTQRIRLRTIFHSEFDVASGENRLRPTGCIPTFACELVRDGHLKLDLFLKGIDSQSDSDS